MVLPFSYSAPSALQHSAHTNPRAPGTEADRPDTTLVEYRATIAYQKATRSHAVYQYYEGDAQGIQDSQVLGTLY